MLITSLPNHNDPSFDEQRHFSRFGIQNIVFRASSTHAGCERHVGCLSIKTILNGTEWYGIDGRQIPVRPGQFLMLNDKQEYSCRMAENTRTDILSIFFGRAFASSVLQDATSREEQSLDNGNLAGTTLPEFFQTLQPLGPELDTSLERITAALNKAPYNQQAVDEQLVFLLQDLLRAHAGIMEARQRVKSVKPATRAEIFKRLCLAKDYMHASLEQKADLTLISHISCMSIPQLVRQFNAVFGMTPHQYLIRIRLGHAAGLLKRSTTSIQDICAACGFEDVSAFCRAFKQHYNMQPTSFRAMHA